MEITIRTLPELEAEATRFAASLAPREEGATLVTLSGELGAGKTAFTKALALALGVEETVTSPTFVLEKIYKLGHPMSKFKHLVHIDAYRLESGAELAALGFDEILLGAGNLVVFEWPERAGDVLLAPAVRVSLVVNEDGSRTISYG